MQNVTSLAAWAYLGATLALTGLAVREVWVLRLVPPIDPIDTPLPNGGHGLLLCWGGSGNSSSRNPAERNHELDVWIAAVADMRTAILIIRSMLYNYVGQVNDTAKLFGYSQNVDEKERRTADSSEREYERQQISWIFTTITRPCSVVNLKLRKQCTPQCLHGCTTPTCNRTCKALQPVSIVCDGSGCAVYNGFPFTRARKRWNVAWKSFHKAREKCNNGLK